MSVSAAIAGHVTRPFGRLAFEANGDGPTLVFAHGLGGNHLSWWMQVAHFKATHRCVTFSHRGFLPSDLVPGGPDPFDYANDLLALFDFLSIERAVVVAQSMGGWTAVEFALKHPERVAGLVFAATTGSIDFAQTKHPALAAMPAWERFAQAELAACAAEDVHVACGRRLAKDEPALHELYKQIDRINSGLDKQEVRRRLWRMRVRAPSDLDQIPAPKLFIAGADDIVIPPCGVEALAKTAANARFLQIDETGHSAYFQRAIRFNAEVGAFLRDISQI